MKDKNTSIKKQFIIVTIIIVSGIALELLIALGARLLSNIIQ